MRINSFCMLLDLAFCERVSFLLHSNISKKREIQIACNSAVWAVAGLPRKGNHPLTYVRRSLGILSVEEVSESLVLFEAWKMKPQMGQFVGPQTRANARGDVKLPKKKGWSGKTIHTKILEGWNSLPGFIRAEDNKKKGKTSHQ